MVRDAQLEMEILSTVHCLRCPPALAAAPQDAMPATPAPAPAPAEESSSSSLFPPATPALMEKAPLNGSLGSIEAFDDDNDDADDKFVLVDFIGDAMENMNDDNNNSNTLNTSSIGE